MNSGNSIWERIKDPEKGAFIIAGINSNYIQTKEAKLVEEYLSNAEKLVDLAIDAGVDAVKFQTHHVEDEQLNLDTKIPFFDNVDRYEWADFNTKLAPVGDFWLPLKRYCDNKGVTFMSTPMSRGAARILNEEVGVEVWKIGSPDILDFVMLDYLRSTGKPLLMSTGMSTLEETEKTINFLREKNDKLAILHAISKSPCPPNELNLKTIDFYKERLDIPVGFSDHSIGIKSALTAVAMGARVIEKSFSLSRDLWGPSHKSSLDHYELTNLIKEIRFFEKDRSQKESILKNEYATRSMGDKEKVLQREEVEARPIMRRALVACQDIPAGTEITKEMLYAMRPQGYINGLPSEMYVEVLGKLTKKDYKKYDPIDETILE